MTLVSCIGPCAERIRSRNLVNTAADGQLAKVQLEHTLAMMLRSAAPKLLLWGSELLAFYNDAFTELITAVDPEGLGTNFPELQPDSWRILEPFVTRSLDGEGQIEVDLGLYWGSGFNREICRSYFTPIMSKTDQALAVLIEIHDLTDDTQLSECFLIENRQLQNLFKEAPVMIAYASTDLKIQFVNPAFQKFYGFRPLEGLTVAEAIPEAAEQGFTMLIESVIETGQPYIGNDVPVMVREGDIENLKYTDFIYQPVKDKNGRVAGVLCTGKDVTEKVQGQIDRDKLRNRILHSNRVNAMGTVAMTLAHELNQPLAAATNYLNAAHRFLGDEGATRYGEAISGIAAARDQIIRAGDIIRRMRPLIRSGEAERQKVSISTTVDNAVNLLEASDGFCLKVTKKISRAASAVLADPIQLEQVLINLLRNASEASRKADRREVVVSTKLLRANCVTISVRDFGTGLAPDMIAELQGLKPQSGKQGLGVGLALSRTLIEANRGNLHAKTAPNGEGGAIIIFELELA